MTELEQLDWPAWAAADEARRDALVAEAARRVGGRVEGGSRGACVRVRDRSLVLVPGGEVELGWDGGAVALSPAQRAAWSADPASESFEDFLRYYLGPRRRVTLAPILVDVATQPAGELGADYDAEDPEATVRVAIARAGFRLLTDDEWENAARAGARTMFRWGDAWPEGEPYGDRTRFTGHRQPGANGLVFLDDPYQVEVVADSEWLRAGDGGSALCGGRPEPEAWYSFALAFRWPRALWGDVIHEAYETAHVRRALSLF